MGVGILCHIGSKPGRIGLGPRLQKHVGNGGDGGGGGFDGSGIPRIMGQGSYGDGRRLDNRKTGRYGNARCLSNLRPIPKHAVVEAEGKERTLILCNARSINNKSSTLRDYFVEQEVDLACVTETWTREGETVALKDLAPPGYSVLYQSRPNVRGGGVAILIMEAFSFRALPSPLIQGVECVGLEWGSVENLAIWVVYRPPSAPPAALSSLLEAVMAWALQYPRLLVLGDFNVHADSPSSRIDLDLMSTMAALGFSQFVTGPTHQAGHTLDLVFGVGVQVDLMATDVVPWSDHYALKARLKVPPPPGWAAGVF